MDISSLLRPETIKAISEGGALVVSMVINFVQLAAIIGLVSQTRSQTKDFLTSTKEYMGLSKEYTGLAIKLTEVMTRLQDTMSQVCSTMDKMQVAVQECVNILDPR